MKARKIKPDLRAVYESREAHWRRLRNCEAADAKTAEVLRKMRAEPDPTVKMAEDAAARQDPKEILMLLDNQWGLAFVADNIEWLKALGKYETCLVEAYAGTRTNFSHWALSVVMALFNMADREKLLAAGDTLPPGDTFTLYRGVAGNGRGRRPSGPSWTSNFEVAKWFALRGVGMGLNDPAIYRSTVRREDVLFYYNGRGEDDFVLFVNRPKRMPIDLKGQKNAAWAGEVLKQKPPISPHAKTRPTPRKRA